LLITALQRNLKEEGRSLPRRGEDIVAKKKEVLFWSACSIKNRFGYSGERASEKNDSQQGG